MQLAAGSLLQTVTSPAMQSESWSYEMPTTATHNSKVSLAKFNGICKLCGKPIKQGAQIVPCEHDHPHGKGKFIHKECAGDCEGGNVTPPAPRITPTPVETTTPVQNGGLTRNVFQRLFDEAMANYDLELDVSDELKPIDDKIDSLTKELTNRLKQYEDQLAKVATQRSGNGTFKLDIQIAQLPKVTLKETPHRAFDRVLRLCANRRNVMLVGPTGSGKTHLAEMVATVMKLPFGFVSCSAGMSEGHLNGRLLPTGKQGTFEYIISEFVKAYETGGVFLLDEIDAADSNTLLVINSALANGFMSVPNRPGKPIAKRHKDFICIAAANTFGRGADRMYVGRNQLDEASLERFRYGQVMVDYDESVEAAVCPDVELRSKLTAIRERVFAHGMRRVVSTRFMKDAYVMKQAGDTWEDAFAALTFGWTKDEVAKVAA
jgi:energy-coupling factor transporter ATP-binding protein EcfA2